MRKRYDDVFLSMVAGKHLDQVCERFVLLRLIFMVDGSDRSHAETYED